MTGKSMKSFVSLWKKLFGNNSAVFLLDMDSPVYSFWKMVKAGALPQTSVVIVFLGKSVKEDRNDFMDLALAYPCVWAGEIAILQYDGNRNPTVRPSQRGLFFQG